MTENRFSTKPEYVTWLLSASLQRKWRFVVLRSLWADVIVVIYANLDCFYFLFRVNSRINTCIRYQTIFFNRYPFFDIIWCLRAWFLFCLFALRRRHVGLIRTFSPPFAMQQSNGKERGRNKSKSESTTMTAATLAITGSTKVRSKPKSEACVLTLSGTAVTTMDGLWCHQVTGSTEGLI